jgi:hypothetical protein
MWLKVNLGYSLSERCAMLRGIPRIRPFKEARGFVRGLGLKDQGAWTAWAKSTARPEDIPAGPDAAYKDEWQGFGDWLGTGAIATFNRKYLPFEKAREFAHGLGIKSFFAWLKWLKLGVKPENIPACPGTVYASEWKGWGDWLGTGNTASRGRKYRPFKEARQFVRSLGLKGTMDWMAWWKANRPSDIPAIPENVYKSEWKGYIDWTGSAKRASSDSILSFRKAREFVRALGFKGSAEWYAWSASGQRPLIIPSNPSQAYASQWKGMKDWLGTVGLSKWLPFREARAFARKLGLSGFNDWQKWVKSGAKPENIPAVPCERYPQWKSWGDWLGTGNICFRDMPFFSFKKARKFARGLGLKTTPEWKAWVKSGKRPVFIPACPEVTYASKGWNGIADWLGVEQSKKRAA